MSTWRKLPKWILPPPAGALAGWAASATAGAPAPASWTLSGIAAWGAVPFNWSFIIVAVATGVGSFFGLRAWLDDKPAFAAASDEDMKEVLAKLAALEARLAENPQVPEVTARGFKAAADELAQSDNPADRLAAVEIASGNPIGAADRLMAAVRAESLSNARRARQAARIYAPFDPAKAKSAYALAVELDPDDAWAWIELSRLHQVTGGLTEARRCALQAAQRASDPRDRIGVQLELGKLSMAEGDLDDAQIHFRQASNIAENGTKERPRDMLAWGDRAFVLMSVGDAAAAMGKRALARANYEHAHSLFGKMVELDPDHPYFRRGLVASTMKLAALSLSEGESEMPLSAIEPMVEETKALAETESHDPELHRNVVIAHLLQCDVAIRQSDLRNARTEANRALKAAEQWRRLDPSSIEGQRHRAIVESKLGDIALQDGESAAALEQYEKAHNTIHTMVDSDPTSAVREHDLSVSLEKLGDAHRFAEALEQAASHYDSSLAILKKLARKDGHNAEWHRHLLCMHIKVMDVNVQRKRRFRAFWHAMTASRLANSLAERFPQDGRISQEVRRLQARIALVRGK